MTPESASAATSVTVWPVFAQPEGAVASVRGAVRSMLTVALAVRSFPALSETVLVTLRFAPAPVTVLFVGPAARPESASLAVHATTTSSLYHSAPWPSMPLGAPTAAPLSDGAVLSMLMPVTPALLTLSALSTAVPGTDWLAPSVLSATEPPPVQLLMPDSPSEHVKPTVTFVLFQPAAFGAGLRVASMDGAVLSSFTATEPFPTFPTLSVAVAVFVTPAVFAVWLSVAGVGPVLTPEPASAVVQSTVTSLLFHPAPFGAGLSAPLTTGPVLSAAYEALDVAVRWVQTRLS